MGTRCLHYSTSKAVSVITDAVSPCCAFVNGVLPVLPVLLVIPQNTKTRCVVCQLSRVSCAVCSVSYVSGVVCLGASRHLSLVSTLAFRMLARTLLVFFLRKRRNNNAGMSAAQDVEDALESIASQVRGTTCLAGYIAAWRTTLGGVCCMALPDITANQVPGLRGIFVSDRDGVPILCHSSLPHPQSPTRCVAGTRLPCVFLALLVFIAPLRSSSTPTFVSALLLYSRAGKTKKDDTLDGAFALSADQVGNLMILSVGTQFCGC